MGRLIILGGLNVEFRLLGPLGVKRAAVVVPIDGQRHRRLLAILLLNHNAVVSIDQLIGQLWENPPASARQQVHNAVARLRRSLTASGEADAVNMTEVGYRIRACDEQVDVNRFAIGCARGRVPGLLYDLAQNMLHRHGVDERKRLLV